MEGRHLPEMRLGAHLPNALRLCLAICIPPRLHPTSRLLGQSPFLRTLLRRNAAFPLMSRLPALILVFVLALMTSGCDRLRWKGSGDEAMKRCREKAQKLYEQRDYQGSIEVYEDLLRTDPSHADAHFQIALIYDRNLNDYLNAAYHYNRFIQSPGANPERLDLARGFLENARLQFAATIPNVGGQGSPELVRYKSENAALHRQIEDLKREMVLVRGATAAVKTKPPEITPSPTPPSASVPAGPKTESPRPAPHPRTYTVRRGAGILAISEKMYGNRGRWKEILAANPSIKDPNQIKPGQVLVIP